MSFLDQYHQVNNDQTVSISAEQGSSFAKQIAGDYNPIHDVDSKRFCVPGDLLFALALDRYGLHQRMSFKFRDMVNADAPLFFPVLESGTLQVLNHRQKPALDLELSGESSLNHDQVQDLIRRYVAFSGQNFPHILLPLMQEHDVMINPARPLVIYESMSLELKHLQFDDLELALENTELQIEGKRGTATLHFSLNSSGELVGTGLKTLLLSGLKPYDKVQMDQLYADYLASMGAS